ncbi:MAG: plasmid replication protein, CyRepA1 family [Methylococcaceae bacterium]
MINQTTANQTVTNTALFANHAVPPFSFNHHVDAHTQPFTFNEPEPDTGNFYVIGNRKKVKFGAWYCEGLAHALAIHNARGDGKITLTNMDNLPVVMCDNGELTSVVLENQTQGYDDIRIVADVNHPTDSYHTLQAAYGIKAGHYYLFDTPTLAFSKVEVPDNYRDYTLALIGYAPKESLHKLMSQLVFAVAADVPHKYSQETALELIVNAMATRGLDVRHTALKALEREINKRREFVKHLNQITDYKGTTPHDCDNLTNEEILEIIQRESVNTLFAMGTLFVDVRGMGVGKTNLMALRIKKLSSCAYISYRIGLINDACKRLGLVSYKEGDRHADKIAVCINSLLQFASSVEGKPLFIDEARQVLDAILHSSTIENRKELLELFGQILRAAPFVHIADANMNDETLAFYKRHCGNKLVHVIKNTTAPSTVNHWHLENFDACYHSLLRDMNGGLKGTVACSSESEAQQVRKYLIKNGINHKRILIITSKYKDSQIAKFLADVNTVGRQYDVIIYTSALGTGVSLEMPEFEFAYLLCSNILTSNESLQMLARNRCAKNVYVAFDKPFSTNRVTDEELLREGQIEKVKNFAENTGMILPSNIKETIIFLELDDMIHRTKAQINQDLNDFANNFLLLAELEGRHFVKLIEEKKEKIKNLSQEVKEEQALEIQSAPVVDEPEYNSLKKANVKTREQSASIERYEVCKMTGLPNTPSVPPTLEDIANYQNGYNSILANFELLSANSLKLKEIDLLNYAHRNKTKCLLSRKKIFKAFLKPLLKAQSKGNISHSDLMKALAVLKEHSPELAAEFGNYTDIKPVRVASVIRNFAKKFGYVLENVGRQSTGKRHRTYEIKVMADIERYASNRKELVG